MKRLLLIALSMLALVALVPAVSHAAVRDCGRIAFTPNSDDLASEIRAEHVACKTARAFIRSVGGEAPRRYRGYRCTVKELDTALPSRRYRCVSGGKLIRWVKT